jgi:hypothetical protein
MIAEGAAVGGYTTNESSADADFESCLVRFLLTAADRAVFYLGAAIGGRPEIEGCMVCQKYVIKVHLIGKPHSSVQEVISHQLVDSSGSRSTDENANLYNDPQIIYLLNDRAANFVPVLCKMSIHNKAIEKQTNLSSLESVKSQNNPTDGLALHPVKSVAASPQQVSHLSAQQECLE